MKWFLRIVGFFLMVMMIIAFGLYNAGITHVSLGGGFRNCLIWIQREFRDLPTMHIPNIPRIPKFGENGEDLAWYEVIINFLSTIVDMISSVINTISAAINTIVDILKYAVVISEFIFAFVTHNEWFTETATPNDWYSTVFLLI